MKKNFFRIVFLIFLVMFSSIKKCEAVQFDVVVLPVDILSVCENYFCFPEPSEIVAEDVIKTLNTYNNIGAYSLSDVRAKLSEDEVLKTRTEQFLTNFKATEKIDFPELRRIAQELGVKSIVLIYCYVTNDKTSLKRDLWEVMEISSAFQTTYPFNLTTLAVLTDNVNNVVMWSGRYNKTVTNSDGLLSAQTQTMAASQLEKIKLYSRNNISQNISQNIRLRFFPQDVKTFTISNTSKNKNEEERKFVPGALEHLIKPQMIRELEEGNFNTSNPEEDFIFQL